jgi:hypothetical protein
MVADPAGVPGSNSTNTSDVKPAVHMEVPCGTKKQQKLLQNAP